MRGDGLCIWKPSVYLRQSSLGDFVVGRSVEEYIEKIRHVFDVDVADIEDGNLADIFERIHKASKQLAATDVAIECPSSVVRRLPSFG